MNKHLQSTIVTISLFSALTVTVNASATSKYTECMNDARDTYNESKYTADGVFATAKENASDVRQAVYDRAGATAADKAAADAAYNGVVSTKPPLGSAVVAKNTSIESASSTRSGARISCRTTLITGLDTEYATSNAKELASFNKSYEASIKRFNSASHEKSRAYKRATGADLPATLKKRINYTPVTTVQY